MSACQHGHLARSCEICEKDGRILDLERALREASMSFHLVLNGAKSHIHAETCPTCCDWIKAGEDAVKKADALLGDS